MSVRYPSILGALMGLILLLPWVGAAADPPVVAVPQFGHTRAIRAVAWHPEGRFLATGGEDGTVRIWSMDEELLVAVLRPGGPDAKVLSLAYSPSGDRLFAGDDAGRITSWNGRTGDPLGQVRTNAGPLDVLACDGALLAAGSRGEEALGESSGSVELFAAGSLERRATLPGHVQGVRGLDFGPGGRLLASADGAGALRVWHLDAGRQVAEMNAGVGQSRIHSLFFGAGGATLWFATAGEIGLAAWAEGRVIQRSSAGEWGGRGADEDSLEAMTRSADGSILALAFFDQVAAWTEDGEVRDWSVPRGDIRAVSANRDGSRLAVAAGRDLHVVSPRSDEVQTLYAPGFFGSRSVRFSADGRNLALAVMSSAWVLDLGQDVPPREVRIEGQAIAAMAFTADSRALVACGSDGTVVRQDLATGAREVLADVGEEHDGLAVACGPGGTVALVTGQPPRALLWRPGDGKPREVALPALGDHFWDQEIKAEFTADGDLVVSRIDHRAADLGRLDLDRGQWTELASHDDSLWEIPLSRDGSLAALWPWDGGDGDVLRVVSTRTGRPVASDLDLPEDLTGVVLDAETDRILLSGPRGLLAVPLSSTRGPLRWVGGLEPLSRLALAPGGSLVAGSRSDEQVVLADVASARPLVHLLPYFFHSPRSEGVAYQETTGWLMMSDGFFDGTPAGWRRLVWRTGPGLADFGFPEQYFQDFFFPGLLPRVAKSGRPLRALLEEREDHRALLSWTERDRRLPRVKLRLEGDTPGAGPVSARSVNLLLEVAEHPPEAGRRGSGVRGVRLFRNGILLRRWEGPQADGSLEAREVPLLPGENRFTAYAFNDDGIKSRDARDVVILGADTLARPPRAWLVAIGIDDYQDDPLGAAIGGLGPLDLRFAEADARAVLEALARSMAPLYPGGIVPRPLLGREATREGILEALRGVVREARPEDTVVVHFSGHGLLHRDEEGTHFYLVPSDPGPSARPDSLAAHGISDEELTLVLAGDESRGIPGLQARNILLILDACHSGQALDSDDWRQGPMNAPGLAQLAYDKGMDIITASQSQQAALEAWSLRGRPIGHGLLTYALVAEGLNGGLGPRRDQLLVSDWLELAARRVPELLELEGVKEKAFRITAGHAVRAVQTPRVFRRRAGAPPWAVSGPPPSED